MDVLVMGPHMLSKPLMTEGDGRAAAGLLLQSLVLARYRRHRPAADRARRGSRDGARHRRHGGHRLSAGARTAAPSPRRSGATASASCARAAPRSRRDRSRAGRPTTSPISCRRCGSPLRLPRQDVAVALTDPPIIGLAALAARPRRGMVFFCQDIFPEVAGLLEDFRSPLVNALLDRAESLSRAARGADRRARRHDGVAADPRQGRRRREDDRDSQLGRHDGDRAVAERQRVCARARPRTIGSSCCTPATSGCRRTSTW